MTQFDAASTWARLGTTPVRYHLTLRALFADLAPTPVLPDMTGGIRVSTAPSNAPWILTETGPQQYDAPERSTIVVPAVHVRRGRAVEDVLHALLAAASAEQTITFAAAPAPPDERFNHEEPPTALDVTIAMLEDVRHLVERNRLVATTIVASPKQLPRIMRTCEQTWPAYAEQYVRSPAVPHDRFYVVVAPAYFGSFRQQDDVLHAIVTSSKVVACGVLAPAP